MAHFDTSLITLLAADATGNITSEAFNRANYVTHAVQTITGNASANVRLQASVDGGNWTEVANITGANYTNLSGCFPWVRAQRSDLNTAALTLKIYSVEAVDI